MVTGKELNKVRSAWVNVNGLRIHSRTSSELPLARPEKDGRPPLVLVHGLGVSSRQMVLVAERLTPDFEVFAPDFPGFGLSDKPRKVLNIREMADFLASWLDAAGLGRAALLGLSAGCQVVVDCAVRYPERAEALILVGPTVDPAARTAPRILLRWLREGPQTPQATRAWIRDILDCGPRRLMGIFWDSLQDAIEEKLPHVQAPTLVVRGSRDVIAPDPWAGEVARLLPRGRLAVIPGSGHTVNFDAPLELARVVRLFLEAHKPEASGECRHESPRI